MTGNKRLAMKDSGIPWLGDIPDEWGINRLKYIANIVLGKMLCNEDKGGYYYKPYLKSKNIQWLNVEISDVEEMWFSAEELELYRLKQGDLVLSEGGEVGKTCIWNDELPECYIQNSTHKVTINGNNNNRFFLYLFNIYGDGFQSISRAISIAHLTKEKLMNVPVIVPPLIEQTAIADFLDTKCEKIDTIIALEETTINELKEYKKTIIQKAITKGISNAPLKNSSIDYLGDIPKQWEIKKFTAIFSLAKGLSITKENLQETGVPVVNYGEIHSKYGRELNPEIHSLKYVKETYLETDKNSLLKYGDFVFADTSEDIEGSGNFTFLNSKEKVFAGYHTIIARPIININYLFLSFLCDSYSFRVQIQSRVAGIKVFSITKGLLKEVTIWLPPISDQQVIEEYLEKKTRQIDKLIKLKQQKITELKEYKKSLIYEYVTGKKQFPKETA